MAKIVLAMLGVADIFPLSLFSDITQFERLGTYFEFAAATAGRGTLLVRDHRSCCQSRRTDCPLYECLRRDPCLLDLEMRGQRLFSVVQKTKCPGSQRRHGKYAERAR